MKLHYKPLSKNDFPLLVQWLNHPHVQLWWPTPHKVTLKDVQSKYGLRVDGREKVDCYIVCADQIPFGFIQVYNARLFAREGYNLNQVEELSSIERLAAIDFFIGEPSYLGKGYGTLMIQQFIKQIIGTYYEACIADPDIKNEASIKSLERAGFQKIKELSFQDGHLIQMMVIYIP